MEWARVSGILLHPTSFPGRWGIGDLGDEAYRFVDWLVRAGQHLWQTLALGPTGFEDSPYSSLSAFASNPLLISPDRLLQDGDLTPDDVADVPPFPAQRVDFGLVIQHKTTLLRRAARRFFRRASVERREQFEQFCQSHQNWLDDFALFMAIKAAHNLVSWIEWDPDTALRRSEALTGWREKLADDIRFQKYAQFQFFQQWFTLRNYANECGIKIMGDIPIFVALDSADVWAHPDLFYLDENRHPTVVAGVPPDYFSTTGQLWGNPIYRWDRMADQGYAWWIDRVQHSFSLVDVLRIDHFRGFEAYWEIPTSETTAVKGYWVEGPKAKLFHALQEALGELPIIAEDLGVLTPEVIALRKQFGFPGMKVLQFAFDSDATNPDLPFNHDHNCVVYTGTHDNNTTRGWYESWSEDIKHRVRLYIGIDGHDIAWDFIRLALSSAADIAIIPLQDVLNLGSEARMNQPGQYHGNWQWRYWPGALDDDFIAQRLRTLCDLYGRQGFTRDETGNLGDWLKWTIIPQPIKKDS